MSMSDSWKDPKFAKDYMDNATDTNMNWYEHFVNAESLWSLIPKSTRHALDFGCGPGEFTAALAKKGYSVDGCDGSEAMVTLATETYPDINFFVWDGSTNDEHSNTKYDAIISKLTLHFIDDLHILASNFRPLLRGKGHVIVSVPHPMPTISKAHGVDFEEVSYDTEIGSYGMHVTMIHRSLQDYINPFLDNGFVLTKIVEPQISQEIIEKFSVRQEYAAIPRRLNLRFQKAELL